jgi:hypothetical protein
VKNKMKSLKKFEKCSLTQNQLKKVMGSLASPMTLCKVLGNIVDGNGDGAADAWYAGRSKGCSWAQN